MKNKKITLVKEPVEKPKPKKILRGIKKPSKKHYAMPVALLKQLTEFSNGAYYLISFTTNKQPVLSCHADDPAYGDALKKFCVDYFRSVSKAEKTLMEQSVLHQMMAGIIRRPGEPGSDAPQVAA